MPGKELNGRRVLVVEDEYMLAMDMEQELRDAGATVLGPVPTVEEALALIEAERAVDGAVLDVNLAGEPIFPVADALLDRGVPLVLTTGYDPRAIPARYGGVPRCEKPVDMRAMLRTLADRVGASA